MKPGEFLKQKEKHQRIAKIYSLIKEGIEKAKEAEDGQYILELEGKRFHLKDLRFWNEFTGNSYYCFKKIPGKFLVFGLAVVKDRGYFYTYLPFERTYSGKNRFEDACFVTKVEDIETGRVLYGN